MEEKTQLQWLLAGIGIVVVALIYLWGIRARLKEEIRKRRRRSSASEPMLGDTSPDLAEEALEGHEIGGVGRVTPDHHLADKILVDVEIRPIPRDADAEQTPPLVKPPLTLAKRMNGLKDFKKKLPGRKPGAAPPAPLRPAVEPPPLAEASAPPKTTIALTILAPRHQLFKGVDIQAAAEEGGFLLSEAGLFERHPEGATSMYTPVFSLAHLRKPGSFQPETLDELATPGLLVFMTLPGPLDGMKALDLLVLAVDHVARKLGGVICDEHRHKLTNQGLLNLRDRVAKLERAAR